MRCVADQNQVAAIKGGHQIRVKRPPEIGARKIREFQEVRHGSGPVTNEASDKSLAGLSDIGGVICGWREEPGVELYVPDEIFSIDGENTQGDPATGGVKFVEVVVCPTHGVFR